MPQCLPQELNPHSNMQEYYFYGYINNFFLRVPKLQYKAAMKKEFKNVDILSLEVKACYLFITLFLFFSPLCPNLGHQAHQNNNQSLVETRFNGTPQLSPCKFHEKNVYFRTKNWKPRATNQNKHWKSFLFKQIPSQKCQTKSMEIWDVFCGLYY